MFKKLGQKNDFSRSYDVKRGKKSLKIKQIDVNQKIVFKLNLFFTISFINESTKLKKKKITTI